MIMTRKLKLEMTGHCATLLMLAFLLRCLPLWSPFLLQYFRGPSLPQPTQQEDLSVQNPDTPAPEEPQPHRMQRILPELRFRNVEEDRENTAELDLLPLEPLPDFTELDADRLTIRGNCTLPYDSAALLAAPLADNPSSGDPQILIVQSHSTEAFLPEPGWEYEETELCRTLDPKYSVIRLGDEIAAILEQYGIAVLHDKTINDYPSYAGSYDRMEAIIQAYLEQYPSIRMVLDVHRDAFEEPDGSLGGTAENGTAKVMLVTGTNEGGLYHPDWDTNLSFSLKLEALLDLNSPGLSRGISLTTQRYNQHLTPYSLLAEFGAAGDTLQEALSAARAFAYSLAQLLTGT